MGVNPYITYSLHNQYEGLESPVTLLNLRFRSGERVQFIVTPTADRPRQPFEVSDGRRDRSRPVPVGASKRRLYDSAEAPAVRVSQLDDGVVLRWRPHAVGPDAGVESHAVVHGRVHGRAERRRPAGRRLHATPVRHATARQRLVRFFDFNLRPVRHRQRSRSGSTRGCAGRSCPSPTSSSSTTTTCDRCSIGGSSTPISCSSSCSTPGGCNFFEHPELPTSNSLTSLGTLARWELELI